MIIVEGPDGAGKSTLAKAIGEKFDLEVVAPQRGGKMPEVPVRNRVYRALGKAVQGRHGAKVYDRLYFSELVYGDILRARVDFKPFEQTFVEDVLWAMRPVVIFCLPPLEICLENLKKDPNSAAFLERDDPASLAAEQLTRVYDKYCMIQHRVSFSTEYDYTSDDVHIVCERVGDYLETRKVREYGAG